MDKKNLEEKDIFVILVACFPAKIDLAMQGNTTFVGTTLPQKNMKQSLSIKEESAPFATIHRSRKIWP